MSFLSLLTLRQINMTGAQTFCILMRNSEMFGKKNTFVLGTYFFFLLNILRDSIYMLLNHLHLDYLKKKKGLEAVFVIQKLQKYSFSLQALY